MKPGLSSSILVPKMVTTALSDMSLIMNALHCPSSTRRVGWDLLHFLQEAIVVQLAEDVGNIRLSEEFVEQVVLGGPIALVVGRVLCARQGLLHAARLVLAEPVHLVPVGRPEVLHDIEHEDIRAQGARRPENGPDVVRPHDEADLPVTHAEFDHAALLELFAARMRRCQRQHSDVIWDKCQGLCNFTRSFRETPACWSDIATCC